MRSGSGADVGRGRVADSATHHFQAKLLSFRQVEILFDYVVCRVSGIWSQHMTVQFRVKFLLDGRVLKNTKSILAPSDFVRMKDDILCLPYLHLKITDFSFEIPRLFTSHDYPTSVNTGKSGS